MTIKSEIQRHLGDLHIKPGATKSSGAAVAYVPEWQLKQWLAALPPDIDDTSVLLNDLRQMLNALGLPDGAQAKSPHEVFQEALAEMVRQQARSLALELMLEKFAPQYSKYMDLYADHQTSGLYMKTTYGDLREANKLLGRETHE